MAEQYDIIIVGAGPSGSACSLALHNSRLKIALIDKESFPRRKACGDSIPGPSFTAIDYLNPVWGKELRNFSRSVKIHKTALFGPNGRKITKNWKQFAYNCKRSDFDNFLLDLVRKQTNVVIIENTKITKITRIEDKVQCIVENQKIIESKLIIGCDGANSIVKRALLPISKHDTKNNKAFAVSSYFTGVKEIENDQNEMFYISKYPNGYFWIFPVENGLVNVGFGILQNSRSGKEINISKVLKDIIANDSIIAPRFKQAEMLDQIKGAPLPFGGKRKKISGNRFMLCGDAASLINPLSGAGIDNAIWSGIYAAQQANKCFATSSFGSKTTMKYEKAVYDRLGFLLQKNQIIMRIAVRYPWTIAAIFRLLKQKSNSDSV